MSAILPKDLLVHLEKGNRTIEHLENVFNETEETGASIQSSRQGIIDSWRQSALASSLAPPEWFRYYSSNK